MKILLLQVSDIHIEGNDSERSKRLANISNAVQNIDSDILAVLLVLSGDIAWSGLADQYDMAAAEISGLVLDLQNTFQSIPVYVVGVPGNHDCDFTDPIAKARSHLLHSLEELGTESEIDTGTLDICCQVQSGFFKFLGNLQAIEPTLSVSKAYYEYSLPVGSERILVRCFNTALSSTNPENAGRMFYPPSLTVESERSEPNAYCVAILHHPYNWLAPALKRAVSANIESSCDLVFTGHEHITAYYKKEAFSGLISNYIEGAVFRDRESDDTGFNAAVVDLAANQERLFAYQWKKKHFVEREITDGWRPYRRSHSQRDFALRDEMLSFLQDPGAAFTHPGKPNLLLEDIFVPPNAQQLETDPTNSEGVKRVDVRSEDLLEFVGSRGRVLIVGRERSGKSTLSKVLFRYFYSRDYIPILVNGTLIKHVDVDRFVKLVEDRLQQQYDKPDKDKFNQLHKDRVVLIIDDIDHAKLNARGRFKLLDAIHKRFEKIIILGDDLLWLEEIASGDFAAKVMEGYLQLQLLEYGYVLRSAVIDKWYDVNREYITNPNELEAKIVRAERLIDDVLSKSYLPSYPIFILTLLQSYEEASPVDSAAASYGYLYNVLITKQLAEGDKQLSLDTKLAYLTELAFWMFSAKKRELSRGEFETFHENHCKLYLRIEEKLISRELIRSGILELIHGEFHFKYDYFYYYFLAEYLSRNIETPDVKGVITRLCEELHDDENANVWLFLAHRSRSQFVLDTIVAHSNAIFARIAPMEFGKDIGFLEKLYEKVPELVYVNKTTDEMRRERRLRLDKAEAKKATDSQETKEVTDTILGIVRELKGAIRTLEVMGQIVKSFAGSMQNDPKYRLVKECYDLGLRIIATILSSWESGGTDFVEQTLDVVLARETSIESKEELERLLKQFIFFFSEAGSFNIVKRISHCVGSRDLKPVYRRVLANNPTNAYRLIDASIQLDSSGFPTSDIVALSQRLRENVFCTRILSHLVMHHFYLFNTGEKTKQTVCDKLGIRMQRLRGMDATSRKRKRLPALPAGASEAKQKRDQSEVSAIRPGND